MPQRGAPPTQEVGLADYRGRSRPGLYHHLATVWLALTYLMLGRRRLPPPPPAFSQASPPTSEAPAAPSPPVPTPQPPPLTRDGELPPADGALAPAAHAAGMSLLNFVRAAALAPSPPPRCAIRCGRASKWCTATSVSGPPPCAPASTSFPRSPPTLPLYTMPVRPSAPAPAKRTARPSWRTPVGNPARTGAYQRARDPSEGPDKTRHRRVAKLREGISL